MKTTQNQYPIISLLPLDVGYDPKVLGIEVNLPPVEFLSVMYVNYSSLDDTITGTLEKVRQKLICAGYLVK